MVWCCAKQPHKGAAIHGEYMHSARNTVEAGIDAQVVGAAGV